MRLDGGLILAVAADAALRERVDALGRGESPDPRRASAWPSRRPRVARRLRGAVGLPERDGVLVRAVEARQPGRSAGLERGDLIVAAGGREPRPASTPSTRRSTAPAPAARSSSRSSAAPRSATVAVELSSCG